MKEQIITLRRRRKHKAQSRLQLEKETSQIEGQGLLILHIL